LRFFAALVIFVLFSSLRQKKGAFPGFVNPTDPLPDFNLYSASLRFNSQDITDDEGCRVSQSAIPWIWKLMPERKPVQVRFLISKLKKKKSQISFVA